jgi:hypothetical protein
MNYLTKFFIWLLPLLKTGNCQFSKTYTVESLLSVLKMCMYRETAGMTLRKSLSAFLAPPRKVQIFAKMHRMFMCVLYLLACPEFLTQQNIF